MNAPPSGDAAAARLTGTELAKGRFGWHNPWATILGAVPGESYGLELLRIEMRPDTWFARVQASKAEIDFVDATGQAVPTATALASFERVGGILFENDIPRGDCCTGSGGGGLVYPEIYVGNEARCDVLPSHRGDAATLESASPSSRSSATTSSPRACSAPRDGVRLGGPSAFARRAGTSTGRYLASSRSHRPTYAPDAKSVAAIIAELERARFVPDPYVHTA